MVMRDSFCALKLTGAIEEALSHIKECASCGGMCEDEICHICSDDRRDKSLLCIVESAKDILLLEENGLFDGYYFVLENINDNLLTKLIANVQSGVKEIVFALTPCIQNDALMLFIEDKLKGLDVSYTKIAQGVPTGVSLENIDTLSLSRALQDRVKV
jgi:recombination protein RecR